MSPWSAASAWVGENIRREVFFFPSGGEQLYGSLYTAVTPARPFGIVACGSWGVEADRSDPLLRSVALAMAKLGGAGFVFHYPGYGDSYGDLADVALEDLSQAASDAVTEASRRCPGIEWILAGFMFGASVACLAQREAAVERLLLVRPALRPGAYFERLATSRRPLAPGPAPREMMQPGDAPGMAYGYPIPHRIAEHAAESDAAVSDALAAFEGEGTVISQESREETEPAPPGFEQIGAPGIWRFGALNHPQLSTVTTDWLDRRTGGGGL